MDWLPLTVSPELVVGIGAIAVAWIGIALGRQNRTDDRIRDLEHKVIYRLGTWDQQTSKDALPPTSQADPVIESPEEPRRIPVGKYLPGISVGIAIMAIAGVLLVQDSQDNALENRVQELEGQIQDILERRLLYVNLGKFAVLSGDQQYSGDARTVLRALPVARDMVIDNYLSCDPGYKAVHAWSEITRRGGDDPDSVQIINAKINEQGGVRLGIKSKDPETTGYAYVDVLILCKR